jgi:phage-related protein
MASNLRPIGLGPGADETRRRVLGEWRLIDGLRFERAIHVRHAVQKKTQKTRKAGSAATRAGRRVELALV